MSGSNFIVLNSINTYVKKYTIPILNSRICNRQVVRICGDKIKIIDIFGRVWTGTNEIKIDTAIVKKLLYIIQY